MVDKNDAREWLKEYFRMQTIVGIPQNFETIVDALTAYAAKRVEECAELACEYCSGVILNG